MAIGGFSVGDVIARPDCPKHLWRVQGVSRIAVNGVDYGVHLSVVPCRKDGRRDYRRNRIGWSGPAAAHGAIPGYEVVGHYEGDE